MSAEDEKLLHMRGLLHAAAVMEQATAHAGTTSPYHAGVMQGVAWAIAMNTGETTDALIAKAREDAKLVMRTGDWRRELDLYQELIRQFG